MKSLSSISLMLIIVFQWGQMNSFAEEGEVDLLQCLNPQWQLPEGHYIRQLRRGCKNAGFCPAQMHYDSGQDRLSISYIYNDRQYDMIVEHACLYVNSGLDIHVNIMEDLAEGEIPGLWLIATDRQASKSVPFSQLNKQDESKLIELEQAGSFSRTCQLDYYPEKGLLTGECRSLRRIEDGYDNIYEPVLMANVRPLVEELVTNNTVVNAELDWLKSVHKHLNYKGDKPTPYVWFYSLRWLFGILPQSGELTDTLIESSNIRDLDDSVRKLADRIKQSKNRIKEYSCGFVDAGSLNQQFELYNKNGMLRLSRCFENKMCQNDQKKELYFEMASRHCGQKGLKAKLLGDYVYCHDPQFDDHEVIVEGCQVEAIAVDTRAELIVVKCHELKTLKFMPNPLACLAYSSVFVQVSEDTQLLSCLLDYAEGYPDDEQFEQLVRFILDEFTDGQISKLAKGLQESINKEENRDDTSLLVGGESNDLGAEELNLSDEHTEL